MTKGLKKTECEKWRRQQPLSGETLQSASNNGLLSGKPPDKTPDFETALPASRTPWAIALAACARQERGPCKANSQMTRCRPPCPGVEARVNCTAPGHAQKPGNVLKAKETIHRAEYPDPISKINSNAYNPAAFLEIYLDPAAKRDFIHGSCQAGNKYYPKLFWMD
nr:hypothetical protein [uncultured Ottowia sp.]